MTLTEIAKILHDSTEEGIYFELPHYSSSERLYLNRDGEYFHCTNFGQNTEYTELLQSELDSDNWMPRGWNDPHITEIIKTPKEPEPEVELTQSQKDVLELLERIQNW